MVILLKKDLYFSSVMILVSNRFYEMDIKFDYYFGINIQSIQPIFQFGQKPPNVKSNVYLKLTSNIFVKGFKPHLTSLL